MAKLLPHPHLDVLVLGDHPAAYLAAALLKHKSKLRVLHATLPDQYTPDRLVLVNPETFELHPLLGPLRRKLDLAGIYGLTFLADDPAVRSEYHGKSILSLVACYKDIRAAMVKIAAGEEVEFATPRQLQILRVDETGLDVAIGKQIVHPRVLVLAGTLPDDQQKTLGVPGSWSRGIVHRYTYVRFKGLRAVELGNRPVMPMSLDLQGRLCWGWLMQNGQSVQISVEQPIDTIHQVKPIDLLGHWADVLQRHNVLRPEAQVPMEQAQSLDLPLAGALAHEGLANRTVLIGPAGGFFSACSEDIYPNLWSAIYAADAVKKALKEPHLQDGLQPYRQRWSSTLGDYLRGPQQNLRFLLPLVYRNQVMTMRLTEAILQGRGMVR